VTEQRAAHPLQPEAARDPYDDVAHHRQLMQMLVTVDVREPDARVGEQAALRVISRSSSTGEMSRAMARTASARLLRNVPSSPSTTGQLVKGAPSQRFRCKPKLTPPPIRLTSRNANGVPGMLAMIVVLVTTPASSPRLIPRVISSVSPKSSACTINPRTMLTVLTPISAPTPCHHYRLSGT
jgi:hypothetical protein